MAAIKFGLCSQGGTGEVSSCAIPSGVILPVPTRTSAPTIKRTWWYKNPGLPTVTTTKRDPGDPFDEGVRGIFAARSSSSGVSDDVVLA